MAILRMFSGLVDTIQYDPCHKWDELSGAFNNRTEDNDGIQTHHLSSIMGPRDRHGYIHRGDMINNRGGGKLWVDRIQATIIQLVIVSM